MKSTSLVTLDCETGLLRRYMRGQGNKPIETGRVQLDDWNTNSSDEQISWTMFWDWLQVFRTAYVPPEDPGPRPTAPLRTAQQRRAA